MVQKPMTVMNSMSTTISHSRLTMSIVRVGIPIGMLCIGVTYAHAQARPDPAAAATQMKARYQVALMERALEMAVQQGANMVAQQLPAAVPQMLLFSGPARARGHRLEGYGVFFDVEVPALSQSVLWSFQTLERDLGLTQSLQSLKKHVESVNDTRLRATLEQSLQRIELQMGLTPSVNAGNQADARAPAVGSTAQTVANRPSSVPASSAMQSMESSAPRQSPDAIYELEVKTALIEAMLQSSGSIALAPEEWLTVAARDSGARLSTNEIYDFVTIQLRIKGSDLAAYRADRLSADEARKRVEVRVF